MSTSSSAKNHSKKKESGTERDWPRATTSDSGIERDRSKATTSESGRKRVWPEASTSESGRERDWPKASTSKSGREHDRPKACTSESGRERDWPKASTSKSGREHDRPKACTSESGREHDRPKASTSESGREHDRPKACTSESSRERDRLKATASGSAGPSQHATPPLADRDAGSSHGRVAGIGPDSVHCMAAHVGAQLGDEAAASLAEDVSFKLRQIISAIALQSEMSKKTRVDSSDVIAALALADVGPVAIALRSEMLKKTRVDSSDVIAALPQADVGPVVEATAPQYQEFANEKLCFPVEQLINVSKLALTEQTSFFASHPTMSVELITDNNSLAPNSNISADLQNYYTKIARAILNQRRELKEFALADLMTNPRIGPILPYLFNLAVLVLNDDNLNALNVQSKKPMQSNVLDMVDALCINPYSSDTNIQQQFQRLFPVMVSNILGDGTLSEKMVAVLAKITRTWPSFVLIGKGILFDYISQGTNEQITAPMIKCVMALGRGALVEGLEEHLEYLDEGLREPRRPALWETMLDVATCLLRSEPTTYLEDYVLTDATMYEMLGDSIIPRRTIFPKTETASPDEQSAHKSSDEGVNYSRPLWRPKLRHISTSPAPRKVNRDDVFTPTKFQRVKTIRINIKNCQPLPVTRKISSPVPSSPPTNSRSDRVLVAGGLLHRFKYKTKRETEPAPYHGAMFM